MLDELHKILTAFREHVAGLVNSGMVKTIDDHLDRLAAAAQGGIQSADDAVKTVLDELYTALHGSAPADVPVENPAPPAPVESFMSAADSDGNTAPLATDAPGIAAEDQSMAAARDALAAPTEG